LASVQNRRYIIPGQVISLTSFFSVPKGDHDIRMAYDSTKSGLNASIWTPWFPLLTIEMHLCNIVPGLYMGNIDIGDMFLNFMLHKSIQPAAGVDLTPFFSEELDHSNRQVIWESWGHCAMSFKPSPYQTIQAILHSEEIIRGDRFCPSNIFRWDVVQLNLPGAKDYVPCLPWVSKLRLDDNRIASDLLIYVDDMRTMGSTFAKCRAASRCAASMLNALGIQDAQGKRRDPSMTPGAWEGSIVASNDDSVALLVSQERWEKAQK